MNPTEETIKNMSYMALPGVKDSPFIKRPSVQTESIITAVCDHFKITKEQFLSRSNSRRVAYPRQIAIWLMMEHTQLTQEMIGEVVGKERTTVHHSRQLVIDLMETYPEVRNEITEIKLKIFS
jgi:chromosomal replication initiator protein